MTGLTAERVPPWHLPFLGCDCVWKGGNSAREYVTAQAHASAIRSRFHHAHYIRCLCQRAHCYVSYNDYISNGWGLWRFDQDVSLGTYRYDTPRYKRLTDGITTWADNATPSSTSTRLAITFYHYRSMTQSALTGLL